MRAHELSLAVSGEVFAAWHGGQGAGSSIYIQRVDRSGALIDQPIAVSDGKRFAYEPDLIEAGDQLVVAWYEKEAGDDTLSVRMAGLPRVGQPLWRIAIESKSMSARNPVVRRIGEQLHLAWIEQPAAAAGDDDDRAMVRYQRFSLAGKPLGPARDLGSANRDTWNLNAGLHGDTFVVVYDTDLGSAAHELHLIEVRGDDVRHRQLSADDGHSSLYPDLQINSAGQAALTWFDEKEGNQEVYLAVAPLADLARNAAVKPIRISNTPGDSIGAYLAWNGETIGLAWSDDIDGRREVLAQAFDSLGQPIGPIQQLSSSQEQSSIPAIRAEGTGFLVAWNDYATGGHGPHMEIASSVARIARFDPRK